jgi:hypothetical protein
MAKAKEPAESLTGIATQTAEQITGRAQEAMGNYFSWLQNAMSASPWGNTELTKKFLSYATENASNAFVRAATQPSQEFGRRGQNSERVHDRAIQFVQRAGKGPWRDIYQDGGCNEDAVRSVHVIPLTKSDGKQIEHCCRR